MKKYILNVLFLFIFTLSFSQSNVNCNMSVEINFYPSSGVSPMYKIFVSNNNLKIEKFDLQKKNKKNFYSRKLKKDETVKLEQLIDNIIKKENVENKAILDSWRIELIINNSMYYTETGIRIDTLPEHIQDILHLLTRGSTVKIDLYGFS